MDFTPWLSEEFNKLVEEHKKKNPSAEIPLEQIPSGNNYLDQVHDFSKDPELEAIFNGPGQELQMEAFKIPTWSFTSSGSSENKKNILIPQWKVLSAAQGKFTGFQNEKPGEWIYILIYEGYDEPNDNHQIKIFRKRP